VHRAEEARARLSRILDRNRLGSRRFGKPAVALAGVLSVLCFGIVPRAPKLVAFAPAAAEPQALSTPAFAAAPLPRGEFASASLVPASMHVRTSQARASARMQPENATVHAIARPARTSSVAPRWVKAKAIERAVPAETILVIRTTEQIGPDAWISRLTVLRWKWVPTRTQRVPAAETT
jgi:hypothetical protein